MNRDQRPEHDRPSATRKDHQLGLRRYSLEGTELHNGFGWLNLGDIVCWHPMADPRPEAAAAAAAGEPNHLLAKVLEFDEHYPVVLIRPLAHLSTVWAHVTSLSKVPCSS